MNNFYSFEKVELENHLISNGFKKFNARQLYEWVYKKGVTSIDDMSNISKNLKEYLRKSISFEDLKVSEHQIGKDGTEKF